MPIPPDVMERAAAISQKGIVRWRATTFGTILEVGFRTNPDSECPRVVPLSDDALVDIAYAADIDRGVEWCHLRLLAGYVAYFWNCPETGLRLNACFYVSTDHNNLVESRQTTKWLTGWSSRWRNILDAKLPHAIIKTAVCATNARLALPVMNAVGTLLLQNDRNLVAVRSYLRPLQPIRNDPVALRMELGTVADKIDDAELPTFLRGIRAVVYKLR